MSLDAFSVDSSLLRADVGPSLSRETQRRTSRHCVVRGGCWPLRDANPARKLAIKSYQPDAVNCCAIELGSADVLLRELRI